MRLIENYKFKKNLKWIIILGGNLSGIGKGIATASIGRLLTPQYKVVPIKCDGYFNQDPGTIHPVEHGEVFVLEDGGEVDMDFGHYERFLGINCKINWNITMGRVMREVLDKERRGDYLGQTVQTIPHVTNQIKEHFFEIAQDEEADIVLIEVGGTVGDIENQLYIEALKQLKRDVGTENFLGIIVTEVPVLKGVGEQKSKPTQMAVRQLMSQGIDPDIVIGRCEDPVDEKIKQKIKLFCDVDCVISSHFMSTVYQLPISFYEQGIVESISKKLGIEINPEIEKWKELVNKLMNPSKEINIAICGKYVNLGDSYASIYESLKHAGANLNTKVNTYLIDARELDKNPEKIKQVLEKANGIIIPGGFSTQGVEGKIAIAKYARENGLPFLGICYGLQMAVIDYARNICGLENANTTEVDKETKNPVITILESQKTITNKGGTMRLGSCPAILKAGTIASSLYGTQEVSERHRHRFEVNPKYYDLLEQKGLVLSGKNPNLGVVEFIELPKEKHPYFTATQAHPELKSRLEKPAPLFYGLVKAALEKNNK